MYNGVYSWSMLMYNKKKWIGLRYQIPTRRLASAQVLHTSEVCYDCRHQWSIDGRKSEQ
jgi:hypothetical protein